MCDVFHYLFTFRNNPYNENFLLPSFYASSSNCNQVYLLNFYFKISDEDVEMDDIDEKILDSEPIETAQQKTETQTVKSPEVKLKVDIFSLLIFHCFIVD